LNVSRSVNRAQRGILETAAETARTLSGNVDQDRELIRLLLEVSSRNRKQIEKRLEAGELDAFNQHEEGGVAKPSPHPTNPLDDAAGDSDTARGWRRK
jgi:hypothetical protein